MDFKLMSLMSQNNVFVCFSFREFLTYKRVVVKIIQWSPRTHHSAQTTISPWPILPHPRPHPPPPPTRHPSIISKNISVCVSKIVALSWGWSCLPPYPGDIWQCLETCLVVTTGKGVPLASSGWRPGMPLNILRCTGQPPPSPNKE